MYLKHLYFCLFIFMLSAESKGQPYDLEATIASFLSAGITRQEARNFISYASSIVYTGHYQPLPFTINGQNAYNRLLQEYRLILGDQHPLIRLASLVDERDEIVESLNGVYTSLEMGDRVSIRSNDFNFVVNVDTVVLYWVTTSYRNRKASQEANLMEAQIIEDIVGGHLILPDEFNRDLVDLRENEPRSYRFRITGKMLRFSESLLRLVSITRDIDELIEFYDNGRWI